MVAVTAQPGTGAADVEAWADRAMSGAKADLTDVDPPVWVAETAIADGCMGFGRTEAESLADLRSALSEWAALGLEHGDHVPGLTD